MKTCTKCKGCKTEAEFYVRASGFLHSWCKQCGKNKNKARRLANPVVWNNQARERWRRNLEVNRKAAASRAREARRRDPEKVRERKREAKRLRYHKDPQFRMLGLLRTRIYLALNGADKSARTFELIGCPAVWLEVHLESLFLPGMTWENYGPVWHVDHKRPCASFDLTDPEQQKMCFHWTNLQPLFALENIRKSDTYDPLKVN